MVIAALSPFPIYFFLLPIRTTISIKIYMDAFWDGMLFGFP